MTGPAARDPLPGEPEHRQRWRDADPTTVFCESAAEWDHDWDRGEAGGVCRECGAVSR